MGQTEKRTAIERATARYALPENRVLHRCRGVGGSQSSTFGFGARILGILAVWLADRSSLSMALGSRRMMASSCSVCVAWVFAVFGKPNRLIGLATRITDGRDTVAGEPGGLCARAGLRSGISACILRIFLEIRVTILAGLEVHLGSRCVRVRCGRVLPRGFGMGSSNATGLSGAARDRSHVGGAIAAEAGVH
ncbi:hypothetical protein [Methylobacterium sp. WL9]|uniref:hypothetical protein n=1 Tax=Methylobacterium sp. WL9 TaxID=2603898 RepID=UPI0011C9467E|nr:hypothetical protein [Methylobacterium sp. WL9]TXN20998.1 hypothetical protein FV217_16010 [Methylobacterium sp. WL9]